MSIVNDITNVIVHYNNYKIVSKNWIQFDISVKLFPLDEKIKTAYISCNKKKIMSEFSTRYNNYIAEIVCKFFNKGRKPFKLYNLQVWLNTLKLKREDGSDKKLFDEKTGRLRLSRIFTSGNLLDSNIIDNSQKNSDNYYYIGPQIEQNISFLTLIPEPKEVIQVNGRFSLEQKRIFPSEDIGELNVNPHTASTTYKIGKNGFILDPITQQVG